MSHSSPIDDAFAHDGVDATTSNVVRGSLAALRTLGASARSDAFPVADAALADQA